MKTLITPERAEKILERNSINRPVIKSSVTFLVKAIMTGQFKYNGESVIISSKGNLLDGQHRLLACIRTNTPIEVELVEGVLEETMSTIDTGKARTAGDVLYMHSDVGEGKGVILAGAIRLIMTRFRKAEISKLGYGTEGGSLKISNSEILSFYNDHKEILNPLVDFTKHLYSTGTKIVPPGRIAGYIYLFGYEHPSKPIDFFREIMLGITLGESNMALKIREKLINDKISIKSIPEKTKVDFIIKTFHYYNKDFSRKALSVGRDELITFKEVDIYTEEPKLDIEYMIAHTT